jgi:RimJ/RimL family protein N-acetyltransferase
MPMDASKYSAMEVLRNGREVKIRALRRHDRDALLAATTRAGRRSMFRRFFATKRAFSEQEIAFFVNIDFIAHVALVAVTQENGHPAIIGGARYIVTQPGAAEVAFAVIDAYQGQGLGTALMRHLVAIAQAAGLRELTAEVLPDNTPMLKVLEKSGLPLTVQRQTGVVHVVLQLR